MHPGGWTRTSAGEISTRIPLSEEIAWQETFVSDRFNMIGVLAEYVPLVVTAGNIEQWSRAVMEEATGGSSSRIVTGPRATQVGGLPAVELVLSDRSPTGTEVEKRVLVAAERTTQYLLHCQYTPEGREQVSQACELLLGSFRVTSRSDPLDVGWSPIEDATGLKLMMPPRWEESSPPEGLALAGKLSDPETQENAAVFSAGVEQVPREMSLQAYASVSREQLKDWITVERDHVRLPAGPSEFVRVRRRGGSDGLVFYILKEDNTGFFLAFNFSDSEFQLLEPTIRAIADTLKLDR
jgi:hypothetical protein